MLTKIERMFVANRSANWVGPVCWGYREGCKLNLKESLGNLKFA